MKITWVEEFVQEVFVHFLKVDGKEEISGARFQVVEVNDNEFEMYEIHDADDTWEFTTFTTLAEAKLAAETAAALLAAVRAEMDTKDK